MGERRCDEDTPCGRAVNAAVAAERARWVAALDELPPGCRKIVDEALAAAGEGKP